MEKTPLKRKLAHEAFEYWVNFVYLAAFFSAFTWYRKLILVEYHLSSYNFGFALVEALVLAKVVLVGNALHLGRRLERLPLIFSTLYKATVFSLFAGAFVVLEHTLGGFLHGKGLGYGFHKILSEGREELIARCLILFFSFIPFFAFQELGQTLGEGRIWKLFFRKRR